MMNEGSDKLRGARELRKRTRSDIYTSEKYSYVYA